MKEIVPAGCVELVEKQLEIPPVPIVAAKVMQIMNDPEATNADMSSVVSMDQGLVGSLLRIANSPLYGLPMKVRSMRQAVTILGRKAVRVLVVSASAKQMHKSWGELEEVLWTHSVGAAIASHVLAQAAGIKNVGEAFLAGLLHDVGMVVMNNEEPEKFASARELMISKGMESYQAEAEVFGFTHMDVGAILAGRWNLFDALEYSIYCHHDTECKKKVQDKHLSLVCVTSMAERVCRQLAIGTQRPADEVDWDIEPEVLMLGLDEDQMPELIQLTETTYEAHKEAFLPAPE